MKKILFLLFCSTAFANEMTWGEYEANFSMDGKNTSYEDYKNYLEEIINLLNTGLRLWNDVVVQYE